MPPGKTDKKPPQRPSGEQEQAARDFLRHITGAGRLRRRILRLRLCYERLRLGADVPSPHFYKIYLHLRQKIPAFTYPFPPLTIGQWLCLLDSFAKKDNKSPSL